MVDFVAKIEAISVSLMNCEISGARKVPGNAFKIVRKSWTLFTSDQASRYMPRRTLRSLSNSGYLEMMCPAV